MIAGSTTDSLSSIYIMSLSYRLEPLRAAPASGDRGALSAMFNASGNAASIQEVRVGYLGLCARTSFDLWICDSPPSDLVQTLRDIDQTDPLNLLWVGNQFRTQAVTSIFL